MIRLIETAVGLYFQPTIATPKSLLLRFCSAHGDYRRPLSSSFDRFWLYWIIFHLYILKPGDPIIPSVLLFITTRAQARWDLNRCPFSRPIIFLISLHLLPPLFLRLFGFALRVNTFPPTCLSVCLFGTLYTASTLIFLRIFVTLTGYCSYQLNLCQFYIGSRVYIDRPSRVQIKRKWYKVAELRSTHSPPHPCCSRSFTLAYLSILLNTSDLLMILRMILSRLGFQRLQGKWTGTHEKFVVEQIFNRV